MSNNRCHITRPHKQLHIHSSESETVLTCVALRWLECSHLGSSILPQMIQLFSLILKTHTHTKQKKNKKQKTKKPKNQKKKKKKNKTKQKTRQDKTTHGSWVAAMAETAHCYSRKSCKASCQVTDRLIDENKGVQYGGAPDVLGRQVRKMRRRRPHTVPGPQPVERCTTREYQVQTAWRPRYARRRSTMAAQTPRLRGLDMLCKQTATLRRYFNFARAFRTQYRWFSINETLFFTFC